jgi:PBSX family phage terminase large subunit
MKMIIPDAFNELFLPARHKIYYGGRGGGKSESFARALLVKASTERLIILCAREIHDSISDSVYALLVDIIEEYQLPHFNILKTEIIHNLTRSRFIFKGLYRNINSIKSVKGIKICWVEEADAVSQESWDLLLPTIREPNSEIWVSFNRRLRQDPVYMEFVENTKPDSVVRKVNYYDNPFFGSPLQEQMEYDRVTQPLKYKSVWLGEPKEGNEFAPIKLHMLQYPETLPDMERIVVAIDPAVTNTAGSDETGIIVAGKVGYKGYILEDLSGKYSPNEWATIAVNAYNKWKADCIVAEVNNGGDMVKHTIRTVDRNCRYKEVRASKGKAMRFEPVAGLYEEMRVFHNGKGLYKLEEQLLNMTIDFDRKINGSPDRLDAAVWGLSDLLLHTGAEPSVRQL